MTDGRYVLTPRLRTCPVREGERHERCAQVMSPQGLANVTLLEECFAVDARSTQVSAKVAG